MADVEEEILLPANLLLLLVLKRRHRQLQNRRRRRFWFRKIFLKRRELGAFHTFVRDFVFPTESTSSGNISGALAYVSAYNHAFENSVMSDNENNPPSTAMYNGFLTQTVRGNTKNNRQQ